jgi:hypothetical protein
MASAAQVDGVSANQAACLPSASATEAASMARNSTAQPAARSVGAAF